MIVRKGKNEMNLFKKQYKYFVSYSFKNKVSRGSGMTELEFNLPVRTFADIKAMADYLKTILEAETVIIINYKKIK